MEKVLIDRLRATFDANFRLTRLYARLLEECPDVITEEMIRAMTEDGDTTKEEAIVAILSELFGLDWDNPKDRTLIRSYLIPSVRILDAKRYTENPYYKNIKISDIKDGDWELRLESYKPYRAVIAGDMEIYDDFREVAPLGFFTEEFRFPAVLEGGNEWMTLTPVDLDTSDEAIEAAHGRVVTFGLGLGYYAYMCSEKEEVESITVIEKSPDVIKLFKTHILPQFPNKDKVTVIEADAFEYAGKDMAAAKYDVAFVDTWRDASDGTPMYIKMKSFEYLSPNTKFLYWIENFLISRKRSILYSELMEMYDNGGAGGKLTYDTIARLLKR